MRILFKISLGLWIIVATISCSSVRVHTDHDKDTDIKDYSTFHWQSFKEIEGKRLHPLYYNELNDTRIKAAVDQELIKKGFTKVETDGQLILHYHIVLEEKATPVTLDPEDHQYSPRWSQRNVDVYQYTEGTLIIDLMDEEKNKIVWRGWIVGVVDASNMVNSEETIKKAVALIFEKFPN